MAIDTVTHMTVESLNPKAHKDFDTTRFVRFELEGAMYGILRDGTKELLQEEVVINFEIQQ